MPPPARTTERSAFRRLAVATAVAALVLVAVGGAVRATDSGLACPTWPGCFSAGDFLPAADVHVWTEHTHRLLAGVVGLLIAGQLLWVLTRLRRDRILLALVAVAAVLVNVQALLGALVVWHLLRPGLVTTHLGLALAVVAVQLAVAVRAAQPAATVPGSADRGRGSAATSPAYRRAVVAVAALAYVTILVGAAVTGAGAGLAYRDRPLLGILAVGPVPGSAELLNVAHRVLAVLLLAGVLVLVRAASREGLAGWPARLPVLAAGLVLVQIALGVANLASGLSFLTVIPHLAVASWIWTVLVLAGLLASGPATGRQTPADRPPVAEAVPA